MFEPHQLSDNVIMRTLRPSDASALAAAYYVRNREYLSTWEPVRPAEYYTGAWQAADTLTCRQQASIANHGTPHSTWGSLSGHDFAGITVVMAHNPARMNPTTTSTMIQPKVRQELLPLPAVTLPQFKYFSDAAWCLSVERPGDSRRLLFCSHHASRLRWATRERHLLPARWGTFSGPAFGRWNGTGG